MSIIYKSKKLYKKVLTRRGKSGRIVESPRGDNEILRKRALKKPRKKLEKSFKKGIDKVKQVWYNNKAVAKKGSERSLKIEQQEISTKQKQSANLVKRVIYTQQSKRS